MMAKGNSLLFGRRGLQKIVVVGALLVSTSFAGYAQEKCTDMQILLSIAPNHREDVTEYIAPRLKSKLGVSLSIEQVNSIVMVDRIASQGNKPRVSLAHWDVPVGLMACERGLCDPIDQTKASNTKVLADEYLDRDANKSIIQVSAGVIGVGILYNEKALQDKGIAPPKSWLDLAKPEFKGRVALTAPQSGMGVAALVMMAKAKGGSEKNIDPGFQFAKELAKDNTKLVSSSELSNLLQLGDVWIGLNRSDLVPTLKEAGVPMKFARPDEGAPTNNTGLSLVKNGPCREAAYEYINLYFSPEFQALRMVNGGLPSPVPDSWKLLTPAQAQRLGITQSEVASFVRLDWKQINESRPSWIERWQRELN